MRRREKRGEDESEYDGEEKERIEKGQDEKEKDIEEEEEKIRSRMENTKIKL